MPEDTKTPRRLPINPEDNREAQICKVQNQFEDGKTEEHSVVYAPYGLLDFGENPNIEAKSIITTDNKKQFYAAIELGGKTPQEKEAHETVAYHMGEILNELSIQAITKKPIDYLYTSQIVEEAIRRTREDGIDSPYLTELYLMQHPEEDTMDLAFPDFPPEDKREARKRVQAPPFIYNDKTTIPLTLLSRTVDRLKFTDMNQEQAEQFGVEKGAYTILPIDAAPHKKNIYMVLLDKLADEYPITAVDKSILISLGNLYAERKNDNRYTGPNGGVLVTAEDVIRRERGLDAIARLNQANITEKENRLYVLKNLLVSLNFSQHFEYRKRDIGDGEEVELDIPDDLKEKKDGTLIRFSFHGNMLHADVWEGEYASGRIVKVFEILSPPIVYEYAMKIKQVATIETKLLDLRKKANGSRDADVMKVYLLERILAMIDHKTHRPRPDFSHTIKLDKLFEDLRIDVQNRKTKKVKVDLLKRILDHFKETEDKHRGTFIKGYIEKKGYRGSVTGYEILF